MPYSQKYYTAMELQQSLLRDIKDSPEQIKKVLRTGSNLYRLPFSGQLMVGHCKPDAVMVASYDQWNRLSCTVKRGSHGIAIPNSDGTLSYVFDVNDTIAVTTPDKRPKRWEFQVDMENRVSERLNREFGLAKKAYSLSEQIMILSERFARELMEDSDFREEVYRDENLLPETVQNAERTMSSIMAYSVMKRMNLDTDYFEKTGRINFEYAKNLSDEVFLGLAEAISQQAGEVLHAAALEVIAIRKERTERSSQYHRDNDILQINSEPVQISGQMRPLTENDQSNSLYITSLNRERTENGNFPMVPGQAEQMGNIIVGMLKEDTAPEEIKKALDTVFSYIPDEEKAAISLCYKENGRGDRFRDVIHNQIKQYVPILDSASDGICILDDKGEQIDLTWRSVEDIIEQAVKQENFVDERTENRVREKLEHSKANLLEGKIKEWSQNIKKQCDQIGNVRLTSDLIPFDVADGTYVVLKNASVTNDNSKYTDIQQIEQSLAARFAFAVYKDNSPEGKDRLLNIKNQVIKGFGEINAFIHKLVLSADTGIDEIKDDLSVSEMDITEFDPLNESEHMDKQEEVIKISFDNERESVRSEHPETDRAVFGIFQLRKLPELCDIHYAGMDELKKLGVEPDASNYEKVYSAELEGKNLETIYTQFQVNRPADFKGHALSVSDVIVLQESDDRKAYFVDDTGFKQLSQEFTKALEGSEQGKELLDFTELRVGDVIQSGIDGQIYSIASKTEVYESGSCGYTLSLKEDERNTVFRTSDRLEKEKFIHIRSEQPENDSVSHDGTKDKITDMDVPSVEEYADEKEPGKNVSFIQQIMHGGRSDGKQSNGNFQIKDPLLGEGTPKEKSQRNIEAIKLLKELEANSQKADDRQKEILSQYIGWGGLPDIFDESKDNWKGEREALQTLLTEEEYRSARASVKDSFYTSPVIIEAVYNKLADMGLQEGKMLEPSCGVGNFIGKIPDKMHLDVTGVELDSVSGRIAQMLYPDSDIQIKGFEKTSFQNEMFDVAVGNVPFGDFRLHDKEYNKEKLLIHDYFFVKTLDKVKAGGVVAFITSRGTMDKKNSKARQIISEKADFLGAVRLPNTAFKKNAGTEVTSDIIFLQKKTIPDHVIDEHFVETKENENGINMNRYFVEHPEQICGQMEMVSGQYGFVATCQPDEGSPLAEQLASALGNIKGQIQTEIDHIPEEAFMGDAAETITDTDARNFSYVVKAGRVYYKEDTEICSLVTDKKTKQLERIINCVELRDKTRKLLDMQTNPNTSDQEIRMMQKELLDVYSQFHKNNGRINDKGNRDAFREDDSYYLICSLEKYDDDGKFIGLADIFTKRTVQPIVEVKAVETAHDALIVSLNRTAEVDIPYIAKLCGQSEEEVIKTLTADQEIFLNPETSRYESADEYLSGNVRLKLRVAEEAAAQQGNLFRNNVSQLKAVQPPEIPATEIAVRLGSTWIGEQVIKDFMRDVLKISNVALDSAFGKPSIDVHYNAFTKQWHIDGKNAWQIQNNTEVSTVYGVKKANALAILEKSLNLKTVQIHTKDENDNTIIDKPETEKAQVRQNLLEQAFKDWVFTDPDRREQLTAKYNEQFNSIRPRTYDGSNLSFEGMNPNIELRPHQKDAVARQIFGGNTLLAHCVGAGKTFTMAAAGMEMKRIGICKKPLYVVPKAVVGQWANEFATLYPTANILVAGQNDFTPANRKKFTARIATGNYDAVIISHSQFEKIALSKEYQERNIQKQIDEAVAFEARLKEENGDRWSVKQMERFVSSLENKLAALNDIDRDDVIDFESLGVDHIFVDESHNFKNLPIRTKMTNVAGLGNSNAQKCIDMLMKCDYLNEITDNRGVTFATGTPVSNTMAELYANMKYLQPDLLEEMGCTQFDEWAANFGSTKTCMEFDPTGQHFQLKTRFAEFFNMPELMTMFKECADIRTTDMLDLKIPEAETHEIVLEPSDIQKNFLSDIVERCNQVKNKLVDPTEDNMLSITSDGRMLAFDQRMLDPELPANEDGKIVVCVNQAFDIYKQYAEEKATQIIFSDLGVPSANKEATRFNAYNDIKERLIEKGVPEAEIAIIHDYNSDKKKDILQRKMRSGEIRFLIGSTQTCGTGLNVQTRLRALHHLDVPWRPSDIEQREGRIVRQGNTFDKVDMYRYVTKNTFDTFSWQTIKNKQHFVSQIMTSKNAVRRMDDIDAEELQATTAMALASGNPKIIDKVNLEKEVNALRVEKASHTNMIYNLQDQVRFILPKKIDKMQRLLQDQLADARTLKANDFDSKNKDIFRMQVNGVEYRDKKEAGEALIAYVRKHAIQHQNGLSCGEYKGFKIKAGYDFATRKYSVALQGKAGHSVFLSDDPNGMITRLDNVLEKIDKEIIPKLEMQMEEITKELQSATENMNKNFPKEEELQKKEMELAVLAKEIESSLSEIPVGSNDDVEEEQQQDITIKKVREETPVSSEDKNKNVLNGRKHEFSSFEMMESDEAGKYDLTAEVNMSGVKQRVVVTSSKTKEELLDWAEKNDVDLLDHSETVKGKIHHQKNIISLHEKRKGQVTPLKSGQAI